MIETWRWRNAPSNLRTWLVAAVVLSVAIYLGSEASLRWAAVLVAAMGGLVLLAQPLLGLPVLVIVALVLPLEIGTGTAVMLNLAAILVPVLIVVWLFALGRHYDVSLPPSSTTRPLALFLLAGLLSLLIGRATWDPSVPVSNNFVLVQLAQWAIFAFSAGAFWLMAALVKDEVWLWRITATFLLVGGGVAIVRSLPGLRGLISNLTTIAFIRAPFWMLLTAVGGGQLLFNRQLSQTWRVFLLATLSVAFVYAFVEQQEGASNWLGLMSVLGMLCWLRFPRLRWIAIALFLVLTVFGVLSSAVYDFAGGDEEWIRSGGSRLALIGRVVEVTMRNPITGLGPAAYRPYANNYPLLYMHIYWTNPQINSHNNYVDLFSHVGLVGLVLFGWFSVEVARLGYHLHRRYGFGFRAGYINGMLSAGFGSLVIMMFADWILPFVYNIGFPGFQASVLVWLFLGGLVAIERMGESA